MWSQALGDIWTLIWIMIKTAVQPNALPWLILIFAVLFIGGWLLGKIGSFLFGEPSGDSIAPGYSSTEYPGKYHNRDGT
jgi:hypothetical protein